MLFSISNVIDSDSIFLIISLNVFKSTSGVFKLLTMNPDEFTRLPVFNVDKEIEISEKMFKDMVKKTVFATSSDQNRPVYTGALVDVRDGVVNIVAIDGFRMDIRKEYLERSSDFKAIIPAKSLTEIIKTLSDSDENMLRIGVNKTKRYLEWVLVLL